jgi:hypothetical protein
VSREGHLQIHQLIIITTAVAYATIASAEQDTELERCARHVSDTERLACFDAFIERHDEGIEAAASGEASRDSVTVPEVEVLQQPSETRAVTQSETTVQEAQPSRRQDESPNGKRDRPKEYTVTVVAIHERPHGQKAVTLDDGETWSEQYASGAFLVNVGDTVTMKKGLLSSSYRLIAPGGRGYRMTLLDQ